MRWIESDEMKIYFVRHGETKWNTEKKIQGQTDIELNEFGRILATKTGKGMEDVRFDMVFSSPLKRAYETAELILAQNKAWNNQDNTIICDHRLKEIALGVYEGLCCNIDENNRLDDNFLKFFADCVGYKKPEQGENFQEVINRIHSFLDELLSRIDLLDKTILVVSHGVINRGIVNYFTNNPIESYWNGGVHKNCGTTIVEYDGNQSVIEIENKVYYDDVVEEWHNFEKDGTQG